MGELRRVGPARRTSREGGSLRLPLVLGTGLGAVVGGIVLLLLVRPAREGHVAFEVKPPEAEVAVLLPEGRRMLSGGADGVTTVLAAGPYRAEVSAPGFVMRPVEFEVIGGELRTVAVELAPAVGSIAFEVEPARARLQVVQHEGGEARELPLVDGRWKGELKVGAWVARVTADGFVEESIPFEVSTAEPTSLPISLHAVARARRSTPETVHETLHETVMVPAPVPVPPPYYGPGYYGPRFYGPGPPLPHAPGVPRPPRPPHPPRPPLP